VWCVKVCGYMGSGMSTVDLLCHQQGWRVKFCSYKGSGMSTVDRFVTSRGDVWSFIVIWGVACPLLICFVRSRSDVWSFVVILGVACPLLICLVSSRSDVWSSITLWGVACPLLICFVSSRGDVWSSIILWGVACPLLICFVSSRGDICVYDFTVSWFVPCHLLISCFERASEWMPRHTKNIHAHYTGSLSRTSDNPVRRLLTLQKYSGNCKYHLILTLHNQYTAIIFVNKISGNGHALYFLWRKTWIFLYILNELECFYVWDKNTAFCSGRTEWKEVLFQFQYEFSMIWIGFVFRLYLHHGVSWQWRYF
jgi:hypothetical protein